MYNYNDVGSSYAALPPNLQTIENECFLYAFDRQVAKLHEIAKKLTVWSDLDNVDPKYYDFMAICIQAPYYKPEYTDEQKLNLLKTAIMSYRYAGTRRAVDQLIDIVFDSAKFIPWYEYDGIPYHFRINVSDRMTEDAIELFSKVLKKVKAARSVLDAVHIDRESCGAMWVAAAPRTYYKNTPIRE